MDVLGWPRLPPRRASLSAIDPRSSQTAPPGPSGSTSGAAGTPPQPAPQRGAPSVRDASSQRTLLVFFVQRRRSPTWHGMLYMCHVTLFQTRWTCTDLLVIILTVSAFFTHAPPILSIVWACVIHAELISAAAAAAATAAAEAVFE